MNTRIQQVIEEMGIKKIDFAKTIGVSPAFVSELWSGKKSPSDRTIRDICDKFNVNETWLRFGEGSMFVERTREEEIALFLGKVADGPNNFKKRLISVLANLDEDGWQLLADMAEKLAEEAKKDPDQ